MTFQEFVVSLFEDSQTYRRSVFKEKLFSITGTDIQSFWNSLLSFLQNQISQEKTTLLRADFTNNSFFSYYTKKNNIGQTSCDLDVEDVTELTDYWNESIQRMIDYFNQYFNSEESTINTLDTSRIENGHIPNSLNSSFNSHDITGADAGYLFGDITGDILVDFVKPWYNIQFNSYYAVRTDSVHHQTNSDRIDKKAVQTKDNLTFTRNQQIVNNEALEEYIRLIMPNNSRRVSVEDLNRNFWVISSVLQAITTYLFDPAAPIPALLQSILNELVQLWENIMYLWAAFGLISQKEASDMRVIIMPLPVNSLQHYMKYDDYEETYTDTTFNKDNFGTLVRPRLQYLTKLYPNSNLCILFYTRYKNYYKSYFKGQTFRGAVFYNVKKNSFSYVPFKAVTSTNPSASIYFDPENYKSKIFAARETDTYYKWTFPYSHVGDLVEDSTQHRYFGALRVIPEVNFEINSSGELQVSTLKLTGIDAIEESVYGEGKTLVTYELTEPFTENSDWGIFSMEQNQDEPAFGNLSIYETTISQAYYLGEIPSCSNLTSNHRVFKFRDDINIEGDGKLIKIGNYLPAKFSESPQYYYKNSSYYGIQKAPNGQPTDYLLNLTITGDNHVTTVSDIYGSFGSASYVDSKDCKLYIPKINENGTVEIEDRDITSNNMDANKYKELGFEIISKYLQYKEQPKNITYFIAGVGTYPWHNAYSTAENHIFQGYWIVNMLTHAYRYVPSEFTKYFPDGMDIIKNNVKIGTLYCIGEINKQERRFEIGGNNTNTFKEVNRTTWRLPQLNPRRDIAQYYTFSELTTGTEYFVDPATWPEPNQTGEQIQDTLNAYYQQYPDGHDYDGYLLTESSLNLNASRGTWCVFDGNSNFNRINNTESYRRDNTRREVAELNVAFNPNGISVSSGTPQGRYIHDNIQDDVWQDTDLPTVLPDGQANMIYSWQKPST